jgi:hypothetical protein
LNKLKFNFELQKNNLPIAEFKVKEIIIERILDYIKKQQLRKEIFQDTAKGKTNYSITENRTLFPKQESSAPVSDYHTFMNSLLIKMIDTY